MSDSQHTNLGDFSGLRPGERAAHYRQLAERHLRLAARIEATEAKEAHLQLAALWARLSRQAERQAEAEEGRGSGSPEWLGADTTAGR